MSGHVCQYWFREDGRQRQCGLPATHYRTTDARKTYYLCTSHARQVEENTKGRVVPSPLKNPDQIAAEQAGRVTPCAPTGGQGTDRPTSKSSTIHAQPPQ